MTGQHQDQKHKLDAEEVGKNCIVTCSCLELLSICYFGCSSISMVSYWDAVLLAMEA